MKIQEAMYRKLVQLLLEDSRKGSEIRRLARRMPDGAIVRARNEAGKKFHQELVDRWQQR